jgi:hypothetical protein
VCPSVDGWCEGGGDRHQVGEIGETGEAGDAGAL